MPDLDRLIDQGLNLYGSGDLDGALAKWEEVLSLDPENPQANSYVDYVRSNYDALSDGGFGATDAPFGIEDEPEYVIEVEAADAREPRSLPRPESEDEDEPPSELELEADEPPLGFDDATGEYVGAQPTAIKKRATGFVQAISDARTSKPDLRATRDLPTQPRMPALRVTPEQRALAQLAMSDTKTEDLSVEASAAQMQIASSLALPPPSAHAGAPGGAVSSAPAKSAIAPASPASKSAVAYAQTQPLSPPRPPLVAPPDSTPPSAPPSLLPEAARTATIPEATWRQQGAPFISSLPTQDLGLRLPGAPSPSEPTQDLGLRAAGAASAPSAPPALAIAAAADAERTETSSASNIPTRDFGLRGPGARRPPSVYPDEDETTTQSDARRIRLEAAERAIRDADDASDDDDDLELDRDPGSRGSVLEIRESAATLDPRESTRELPPASRHGAARERDSRDSDSDLDLRTHPHIVLPLDPIATRGAEILIDVDAGAPDRETKDEQLRRRMTALLARANEWLAQRELERAVIAVDLALAEDPTSALAQKLIHRNRDAIMTVFQTYLGDLERQPQLAKPLHLLATTPISPRTAFLLSRVDGMLSIDEILDVSGMPRLEAYQHLCQLFLRGILR